MGRLSKKGQSIVAIHAHRHALISTRANVRTRACALFSSQMHLNLEKKYFALRERDQKMCHDFLDKFHRPLINGEPCIAGLTYPVTF